MRTLIWLMVVIATLNADALSGEWKFEEMIYLNQRIPRSDPNLNLRWTFYQNGTERLYWDRGTADFCERFSHYEYSNNQLQTLVYALNPKNALKCKDDPDMQLGIAASILLETKDAEIWLHLLVGEETLIYVLKKTDGSIKLK